VSDGWARASNVLCVRLDAIGDVVMTAPAIRALKRSRAGRRITLLTSSAGAEIAGLIAEIDDTIVYDAPWLKATRSGAGAAPTYATAERLRVEGFDAAAIFTVYSQSPLPSALLCHLAGIPLRLAHCRENPYGLLTDWIEEPEPQSLVRHEVRRQLDLVGCVGATTPDERLSLRILPEATRRAEGLLGDAGIELGTPWVVVHPGASAESRRYPAAGYAALLRLLRDAGLGVVLTGSPAEVELVECVRAEADTPALSLAGVLDVAGLTALLSLAPVLVSNNSGPVHIACAVGTPVVDIYALTNPQHTPWGVAHRVLFHDVDCRWCYKSVCPQGHHDCVRLVTPQAVCRAVLELLAGTGVGGGAFFGGPLPLSGSVHGNV
jgi:lipopolysaccharide heptosyltransferase II